MFGLWYLIMFALLVLRIVLLVKDKDVLDGVIGVGIIFFIMTLSIPAARNNSKKEVIEIEAFIQQSELTDKTVNYDLRNKYNNKIIDWNESDKWYQKRMLQHSSTKNIDYLK